MEFIGKFRDVSRDLFSGNCQMVFDANYINLEDINAIKDEEQLRITVKKYRRKRSLDANALMWKCIGDIATVICADKWSIYLRMLKRYGKYTYICVRPEVVDSVKEQWRECEIVGDIDINGQQAVQLLCYFGSSTYDTKEFSVLLDGIISEMEDMGLEKPLTKEREVALQLWEENYGKK